MEQGNRNQTLDKKIGAGTLLKFALPTIIATVLMGAFGIVDGVFVSRVIDEYALSATSLVMPFILFTLAIGMMFGTGGNALVAKEVGEGNQDVARADFSLVNYVAFGLTVLLSIIGLLFPDLVLRLLGADASIYDMAREYLMPILIFMPFISAGIIFQQFLMTEGKAHLGMIATIIGGVTSFGLNWLFLLQFQMGLFGAALATSIGYTIPAIFGLFYFMGNRKGILYFVKPKFKASVLIQSSTNGLSEMITMMATSITGILMNNILMDKDGPMAVAAAGIMMAGMGVVSSSFVGYATGISPLISYNHGKEERGRLRKIFSRSLWIIAVLSIASIAVNWLFTDPFIRIYIENPYFYLDGVRMTLPIYEMAENSLRFLSFSYLFMGINTFGSVLFTSFNDGLVSGLLSFARGVVFVVASLLILPAIWGVNGVWLAMPVAELLAIFVTAYFFVRMRKKYHYMV